MERIKLTRNEKKVLRHLVADIAGYPSKMDARQYADACQGLMDKELARAMFATGHEVCSAEATNKGVVYLENNPHLFNPVNWAMVGAFAGIVSVAVTIILFCIGCSILNR